jgi:hypothetical protein
MLESQLYKNSASLEAYLNRATLKGRLGKLASAITSHYKQALKDSNSVKRGSAFSTSSLASLEDDFSDSKLRRASSSKASSHPPGLERPEPNSSEDNISSSLTPVNQNNDSNNSNHRNIVGADVVLNRGGSDTTGMHFIPNDLQGQSDSSLLLTQANNRLSASIDAVAGNNFNANLFMQNNKSGGFGDMMNMGGLGAAGGGVGPMSGVNGMTQQQQHFLASIRQQQEVLNRRMSMGNFPMMTPQATVLQQQQQQQQNSLNMGLFQQQQHQQALLLQQQMQQQQQMQKQRQQQAFQSQQNLSMQNISIMQQQQQQQNALMGMSGNNMAGTVGMGMAMISGNLPTVVPGMGNGPVIGGNGIQAAMMGGVNVGSGDGINNNGMNINGMMGNNNIMPPQGFIPAATPPRGSSTGGGINGDDSNLMSPGSFDSFNW